MPLSPIILASQISQEVWNSGKLKIILKEWEHSPQAHIHTFQYSELFDAITEQVSGNVRKEEMAVYPTQRAIRMRIMELIHDHRFSKLIYSSENKIKSEISRAMLMGSSAFHDKFRERKGADKSTSSTTILHRSASEPIPVHHAILPENFYPKPQSPEVTPSKEESFSFFQYFKRTFSF